MSEVTREELRDEVRGAIKDRAVWFYLLLKELEKGGEIRVQDFAREAIYKFGLMKGDKMGPAATPGEWANNLVTPVGELVFEQEIIEAGNDRAVIEFGHCPLLEAWKEVGAAPEEIKNLCKLARCGDYGRAKPFKMRLEFERLLSEGDDRCRLVVTREV